MNDPFRNYDAWVTREPDLGGDALEQAWEAFVDSDSRVEIEACEEDHPDHNIYEAWESLELLLDARSNRLQDEAWAETLDREETDRRLPDPKDVL